MDFRQSSSTPVSRPEQVAGSAPTPQRPVKMMGKLNMPKWLNMLNVVILFGVAILLALIAFSIARTDGSSKESKLVNASQYQAVFLNNGQVYFGNITDINSDYVRLNNVFYLTQSSATTTATTTANSDYTLIKLGCQQIHDPYDQMVVNRSQITFWENLNKDGKVVQSIKQFNTQNPNGPDCTKVTSDTQASSNASTQGTTPAANTNKQ